MNTSDNRATPAPYYLPLSDEVALFEAAFAARLPVLLKGPTGCGKTRFVEYMAHRLFPGAAPGNSLTTIACHEDLTATDLVGRYLLEGDTTRFQDGPLTRAAKQGGICYLDEIVEARKDTTVLIHSLTDHRRILPIDKTGELLHAHPDFLLVISYNPGYQSLLKDLKTSTRQRFTSIEFDYPELPEETRIIAHETGLPEPEAERLALLGQKVRNLRDQGFESGVSTRLLIYAGALMAGGVAPRRAVASAVVSTLSDDTLVQGAIADVADAVFP